MDKKKKYIIETKGEFQDEPNVFTKIEGNTLTEAMKFAPRGKLIAVYGEI